MQTLSLNQRNIDPTAKDIQSICRFFGIGQLKDYKKEKDSIISHTNSFIFIKTTQGPYALKLYPVHAAKTIVYEYSINRILINHQFLTPPMYASPSGQPFFATCGGLSTCFSYIDGIPAWQCIKQKSTIHQINASMLDLKNILSKNIRHLPSKKPTNLTTTLNNLIRHCRNTISDSTQKTINASLLDVYQIYQQHRPLFTRQWLHKDANLANFLIYKKAVYTLDLESVQQDYILSDLANLVFSALMALPTTTIKMMIKDYFEQHDLDAEYAGVLNALVKIRLIQEYIAQSPREASARLSSYSPAAIHTHLSPVSAKKEMISADTLKKMDDTYMFNLPARRKLIIGVLKKMNSDRRFLA